MLMALVYMLIMNLCCCMWFQYHSMHKGIYRYVNQYRSPRVTVFRYSEHQVVHNIGSSWWRTGCTTDSTGTDFTNQYSVHLIRVAGGILQDRDTSANLKKVNKFNSTNQNMCSDAGTYPGVFSDWELFRETYLGTWLLNGGRIGGPHGTWYTRATLQTAPVSFACSFY